jgi:outer membrane protein TolC
MRETLVRRVGAFWGSFFAVVTAGAIADAQSDPQPLEKLTFTQAIQRALVRSTNVVVATEEIRRAEGHIREVRAASLPTVTGNAIYTRLDANRYIQGRPAPIASIDQLSANITLSVPIIVPQRWAQWSHASSDAKVAVASAEDVRRQTAVTTARAYLLVISQKRTVDINERALKTSKAHYDFAHTRLLGGVGNRVDDVRAEQEMVSDQSQLEAAYVGLARAREALGVLLGDQGPIDVTDDVSIPDAPALNNALEESTHRPDVRASKERLDAADQVKKDSYTDYLPFLIGTFQPFYQNPESLTQPTTGWQAQLLLTIPFYDGGLRYGLSSERESLSAEARAQYDALIRQAKSDVRVAFEAVKRSEASLLAAVNAARLAKDALDLANVAYRAGATTNIEVIDAESRARQAATAAVIAEDTARQARIDLLAASGRFP